MPEATFSTALPALLAATPGLDAALAAIVERRERSGRLPHTLTLEASTAVGDALRHVFTARAVVAASAGRVRIDLAAFLRASAWTEAELAAALYAALGRERRDPSTEARALRAKLELGLVDLDASARRPEAKAFVAAELRGLARSGSALAGRAAADGTERALSLVRGVISCIDALADVSDPIRIQNFSARVLGSSKALRPGGELWRALGQALVDHDPRTRRALDEQGVPPHRTTEIARALDVLGVYHDEAAASVLCFGPLVYAKRGERFDQVLRHSALGESSRLIVHQLREASVEAPGATRATLFENLTPYLDYVDACVERAITGEIVLCSGGQASWAVVAVLRGLARARIPVRHSGDLDRSGVLILRSLARRSGARVEPLFMDTSTHARFASAGLPLAADERRRLERLVAEEAREAPCHGLLRAILDSGIWVEQEQFAEELLEDALRCEA